MDFTPIISWWLVLLIFGFIGWPLAFNLLRHLPDRGYTFARPVGILFTGYILWLGGIFGLLQNNLSGILLSMGLVFGIGFAWQRRRPTIFHWLKREWRYVLAVELLFHGAFIGWVAFKSYNPNIETAGGEKWMEITFINAVLRSSSFPPQDPWLAGFGISYYYFGYVLMATLTQITGIVSTVAFNLYIPTLFALTLTAAFGVVANLVGLHQSQALNITLPKQPRLTMNLIAIGLVAALFVGCLGNLVGVFEVMHQRGLMSAEFWSWLDIRDLKVAPEPAETWIPDRFMWWWRGSRVLTDYNLAGQEQEVIDEFPFFSFLLGDVHPHVLALPFVLFVTALALNLLANASPVYRNEAESEALSTLDSLRQFLQSTLQDLRQAVGGRLAFLLYAIAVGSLGFLNTWDLPIYLGIMSVSFIVWLTYHYPDWQDALWRGIGGTILLAVTSIGLYLPFYATFRSQAGGILPNLWNPTRLPHFFTFFGIFLVAIIGLLLSLSIQNRAWSKPLRWTLPFTLITPIIVLMAIVGGVMLSERGSQFIQGILNDPAVQQQIDSSKSDAILITSFWRHVTTPWVYYLLLSGLLGWVMFLLIGLIKPASTPNDIKTNVPEKFMLILLLMGLALPLAVQQQIGSSKFDGILIISFLRRVTTPWVYLLLSGLLGWVMALLIGLIKPSPADIEQTQDVKENIAEKFVLILLLMGLALPLSVEFMFLRDNFGYRMNTIFKFYFQTWVLMALSSAFAVYYLAQYRRNILAIGWYVSMLLLVMGGLIYPTLAIADKANYFHNEPTLDGMAWIANFAPNDYTGIRWLRDHALPNAVILEAPGSGYVSYQYVGRVSALTGIPTLLGWGGHQSQWRGNYDEPARREPDIEKLFNTTDPQQALALLEQYHVTYVYIGGLERERYKAAGLNKFDLIMDVAFQEGNVTIYQRR